MISWWQRIRGWPARVFLTCWLAYTISWTPYIVREHFAALSLAEEGTLNVRSWLGWTDDIFPGPKGGAFINNNPGASLTGAIPLILLRPVLRRVKTWNASFVRVLPGKDDGEIFRRAAARGLHVYFLLVEFLTVALVMAPVTALTAGYLCLRLAEAGLTPAYAGLSALLYGLATPVLFRAGLLNHNLLVCDAGFAALLLLWPNRRPVSMRHALAAGLLCGYCILCDYSGVVIAATACLYVWLGSEGQPLARRRSLLVAWAAGVVPGVAILAAYQQWAFGLFLLPSQHYMTATAPTSSGYRGFDWPSLTLAWANFFDPRFGLFAFCPALILAFAAPFAAGVRFRVPRREMAVLFTYFALMVLFCAANRYSWLQPLTGFRYLVPVVPALTLLALAAGQALPGIARWGVAIASLIWSFILAGAHENDIRLELSALWQRRGALFWMIRLRDAGIPPVWVDTLTALCLTASALWLMYVIRKLACELGIPAANESGAEIAYRS
jgi:hypothetical protein